MHLAIGAKRVFVMMPLFTEQGVPKPAPECPTRSPASDPNAGTTPFGLSGTVVNPALRVGLRIPAVVDPADHLFRIDF